VLITDNRIEARIIERFLESSGQACETRSPSDAYSDPAFVSSYDLYLVDERLVRNTGADNTVITAARTRPLNLVILSDEKKPENLEAFLCTLVRPIRALDLERVLSIARLVQKKKILA
jgi:hypothetical protein